jgi:hypothetical protein
MTQAFLMAEEHALFPFALPEAWSPVCLAWGLVEWLSRSNGKSVVGNGNTQYAGMANESSDIIRY